MMRRFDATLSLDFYSEAEITEITVAMIKAQGITANEETVKTISRCGRGTCVLPDQITSSLVKIAQRREKKTVNKEDVLHALRGLQAYPNGLSITEKELLKRCISAPLKPMALALGLGVESKAISRACAFLSGMTSTKGEATPYIHITGSGIKTTNFGERYLASAAKDKFAI